MSCIIFRINCSIIKGKRVIPMNQEGSQDPLYIFYRKLDRGKFIDGPSRCYAACDTALPIGFGQTISQPSLVYEMTRKLALGKTHRVLEIGTGTGYQTAFLAEFAGEVYTVERIAALSESARMRLEAMGYRNVFYKVGDGSLGWEDHAPFDRIVVTAAAGELPEPLLAQLKPGGRMVIPLGDPGVQDLCLVTRDTDGHAYSKVLEQVRFVELVGRYGWRRENPPPEDQW